MFAILDTNHFSAVDRDAAAARVFARKAAQHEGALFITVITVEEVTRGWLALLASKKKREQEIPVYQRLKRSAEMFGEWDILDWDADALVVFEELRRRRLKMSTADMKIASIALTHDAMLLTQNLGDFTKVPGLRVENWLEQRP
ncbi:MAG: type II toxin-antitoxin system VapC family toxin [Verrucomicrobiaceae bacterium]|nr:type II toxin-antitoxin system VapC family toxin [Verrucomicrobiaceae bacterium]